MNQTASHLRIPWPILVLVVLMPAAAVSAQAPVASPNDPREHEVPERPKRMQLVPVSDHDTEQAAATVDLLVGSAHDPVGRETGSPSW